MFLWPFFMLAVLFDEFMAGKGTHSEDYED